MSVTKNDIPAIKRFMYEGKYYFYDACTNYLLNTTKEQYAEIAQLESIGLSEYVKLEKNTKQYKDIISLIHKGLFKSLPVDRIEHPMTKYIEHLTNRSVNYLILQVTRDCNFKCRYCLFASDLGMEVGIGHKKIHMDWETAKRSVDFLYKNSKDAPEIIIAFYGGEPFLNFDIIRKVVSYAESKFLTKKISYYITTNGSLLNDEIIDFLIEHRIFLTISLDGSEETQNKHRKFYESGNDTFSIVWKNTMKLREKSKKYFSNNVRFNPVVFLDEKYQNVIDFFETNGISKDSIDGQFASVEGIDYSYIDESNVESNIEEQKSLKNKINEGEFNTRKGVYLNKSIIPNIWHHGGPCVPGILRLYVDVNGIFFPCEKTNSAFSIGDLKNGFNLTKIEEALNIGKISETECKNCWMLRFCKACICNCYDIMSDKISETKKKSYCDFQKKSVETFFENYISTKEKN